MYFTCESKVILSTQLKTVILKSRLGSKWSLGKSIKASTVECVPSHSSPLIWLLWLSFVLLLMAKSVFFCLLSISSTQMLFFWMNEYVTFPRSGKRWSKISQVSPHQNWLVVLTGINGTQICPVTLEDELQDESLIPRLRYPSSSYDKGHETGNRSNISVTGASFPLCCARYLRLDGNNLSPPIPMDVIMCFRHLRSIVL